MELVLGMASLETAEADRPKRSYHHGNLREALLGATHHIVENDGLEAVSLRAIARKAGVSHGAPANHFASKQELLTAYVADAFAGLADVCEDLYANSIDLPPRDQFLRIATVLLNFALQRPNTFRLMMRSEWFDTEQAEVKTPRQRIYNILEGHLIQQNQKAVQPRFAARTKAIAAWSLIHGYATLRSEGVLSSGKDEISGEDRALSILQALMDGIQEPSD